MTLDIGYGGAFYAILPASSLGYDFGPNAGCEMQSVMRLSTNFSALRSQIDGLVAQVEIHSGANRIVSLVTSDAVKELGLEVGSQAIATVKATNVGVELA